MAKQATVRRPSYTSAPKEFLAAVRMLDGRRELYRIRNAIDANDARQVVLDQVMEAVNVLISPCH